MKNLSNKIINKLILLSCGYFDGAMHRFIKKDEGLHLVKAGDNFSPKVLIVSPEFYTEELRLFPLDNKRELLKLLNLELDDTQQALIQTSGHGQSKVNVWSYSALVPMAQFVFPESYLLSLNNNNRNILKVGDVENSSYFLTNVDGAVYSALCRGVIRSPQLFADSIGFKPANVELLSSEDRAKHISASFTAFKWLDVLAFTKRVSKSDSSELLGKTAIPLAIATTLYLSLSSLYLLFNVNLVEKKLAEQRENLGPLLEIQDRYNQKKVHLNELLAVHNNRTNLSELWSVLPSVIPHVVLRNIEVKQNIVKLRGQADRASEIMDIIINNPSVLNAKFDAPIVKGNGIERFNIRFELEQNTKSLEAPVDRLPKVSSKEDR